MAFDGNAYRKGVLAPIEARGGVPASDPFEWYDLPLDDKLRDAAVRSQVDAVWAFWQKQREAPKYRGLILALLARHEEVAPLLWSKDSRRALAEQVRRERAERSADRFSELDAAVGRLVERFGGIPASKVDGLLAFAAERGIDEAAARARIGAHPVVADTARAGAVDPYRRARADLEELGRLLEGPPLPSLFALLDLPPTAGRREIVQARDRVATRNRELLPDRRRALVDDLLAAVTNLLVEGDPQVYLSALAVDVTELVRPRFQAAVLVEDVLTAEDADYLIAEAEALGLDAVRARDVVVTLAREGGVPMPATARRAEPATGVPEGYERTKQDLLPAARAALRAGRVLEAQRLVARAREEAAGFTPPIRALSEEVDAVLAEAAALWAAVEAGTDVVASLQRLQAIASDVLSPTGRRAADLLAETTSVSEALARALALPQGLQEEALLGLADEHPGSVEVRTALEALGLDPPTDLRLTVSHGTVHLTWRPSGSRGRVDYRVSAVDADGRRRVLGTTAACALETAAPAAGGLPSYEVVARRAGVSSTAATTVSPGELPKPVPRLEIVPHGNRLRLTFPAGPGVQVRRLPAGASPPEPGSTVADADALGALVPTMGPGVAVDARPAQPTAYVAVTAPTGIAVVGAAAWYLELPAVTELARSGSMLTWTWPAGVTEVQVVWRSGAAPESPDDPAAQRRKVTNTRYELDGGVAAPPGEDVHVAVFSCTRVASTLITSTAARTSLRY